MDDLWGLLGATAAVACVSLWLRALADAARRDDSDFAAVPHSQKRPVWIAFIAATGPIGALVYYIVARPKMPAVPADVLPHSHDR
jgi:hypothetical protein